MQVGLLGPLAVSDGDGRQVRVPGAPKERAVLEVLALRAGSVVSADQLINAIWGEEPPRSAAKTLQTYVSKLRQQFPGRIETTVGGYRLGVAPEDVDVVAFERLLANGRLELRQGQPGRASDHLAAALGLWRGEPLQDLGDVPGGVADAARLTELRRDAEELRAEARLAMGEHASIVGDLERAVAAEPLREKRWAQLMLALYRSGRQAEALRAFQDLRSLLGEELGLEPSPETRALENSIATQDASLDLSTPSLKSPAAAHPEKRHNLPAQLTRFVGRDRELAQLRQILDRTRLVTLTGPGGAGKTRLALQIAAGMVGDSRDGVWLAELGSIAYQELVNSTVAAVFGILPRPGAAVADSLVEALALQDVVLIMDNCEHVVGAAAKLADKILRGSPQARLIATSREPLGITGEAVFRVPSLSLPSPADDTLAALTSDSLTLFLDRAGDQGVELARDDETVSLVTAICRRLDGMPLALELAAARLRRLSVYDLHERLDERFALLTGGSPSALARQQTLRATVEWSYSLLNEPEKRTLCRLSVFPDQFDLRAAEAIVPDEGSDEFDIANLIGSLVDKSLVVVDAAGMATRFGLLETIRQFARDTLPSDELPRLLERHRAYFVALAEHAAAQPDAAVQWNRLDMVRPDLRQALRQALTEQGGTRDALRMCAALRGYWRWRPWEPDEMLAVLGVLERPEATDDPLLKAEALLSLAKIAERYDFDKGWPLVDEAAAIYRRVGDRRGVAMATSALAVLCFQSHDLERAKDVAAEAAELSRASGEDHALSTALQLLILFCAPEDESAVLSLLEEGLACAARTGHPGTKLVLLSSAADNALRRRDSSAARTYLEEAMAVL
ncbi:MAG TPA: BTAD domain-containing putative transcriptional regulator, partial [Acidimicrobiales bacterium]|nr:BTAD domain-containing putative transcriptional regulator [Acidimicrobiales bacterium]